MRVRIFFISLPFSALVFDSAAAVMVVNCLSMVFSLAIFIPSLAVSVRRCHDTGRSGWWILIVLLPCIGALWFLCLVALPSDIGDNQYGPNPNGAYPDEVWPVAVGILLMILSAFL